MKSEADRRKTFSKWPVTVRDKNHLASARFYSTKLSDIVCCAFCGVQVGHWEEGDDPFKEHQRWSPSFGFIKGLFVGNIPIGSTDQPTTSPEQPNQSYDVCGLHFELTPNSQPERNKYYYLYVFFCCVNAFYNPSTNFQCFFSLQQQTPGFLQLLNIKTTLHNGMDLCTRSLGDTWRGICLLTQCHSPVNILLKA